MKFQIQPWRNVLPIMSCSSLAYDRQSKRFGLLSNSDGCKQFDKSISVGKKMNLIVVGKIPLKLFLAWSMIYRHDGPNLSFEVKWNWYKPFFIHQTRSGSLWAFKSALSNLVAIRHMWRQAVVQKWISVDLYILFLHFLTKVANMDTAALNNM